MFRNYFKIAFRNLYQNKLYVLINVFGLGIAISCCIIAYLNQDFDNQFNAFHTKKDHIFRVESYRMNNGHLYGMAPLSLAEVAKKDIPNIKSTVRFHRDNGVVKHGENTYNDPINFVDENFLDLFDFEVIKGDKNSLKDKSKVMITEADAAKYFGEENPIGKTILFNPNKSSEKSFTVGAVLADPPSNSSIKFSFLSHFDNLTNRDGSAIDKTDWSWLVHVLFLELENPSEAPQVTQSLNQYLDLQNAAGDDFDIKSFHLDPLKDVARNGHSLHWNVLWPSLPPSAVWGPSLLAILLLITACFNLTNTAISLSNRRLKEMGIRKVMGGRRSQLIAQLLSEHFIICGLALLAGVAFVDLFLPAYNGMWDFLDLKADYFSNPTLLLFMGGVLVVASILGGAYPAFYISAFNPSNIFRGSVKFGGTNLFSRILLGFQVMISLSSVVIAIAFVQNSQFQKTADLGYEYSDILVVPTFEEGAFETFRKEIEQNPKVITSAGTRHQLDWMDTQIAYEISGQPFETIYFGIGANYFDVMDLEIKEGRNFNPNLKLDYETSILVNETFAKTHQLDNPIGQKITIDSSEHTIVGLVKDFYYEGFMQPIEPTIMGFVKPEKCLLWVVEAKPENLLALNEEFKSKWNALFPFKPYEGQFQREYMYEDLLISANIVKIMIFLAIITILLSTAGLFALVSLNILKRLKEIAIRKVVGASTGKIAWLINKNYVWIFLTAAIGGSIGGSFVAKMLMSSIYATYVDISILMLIFGSLMIFVIAGLTVGYKIYQVSKTNPADILRAE